MKNGTMKQLAFEIMLERAWLVTERSFILIILYTCSGFNNLTFHKCFLQSALDFILFICFYSDHFSRSKIK